MLYLFLLGVVVFVWLLASPFYWWKRGVPFILPLPIFGNFLSILYLNKKDFFDYLYYNNLNIPYIGIHMFIRPALYLRDPNVILEVLEEKATYFTSHGIYANPDRDPIGASVFHLSGTEWKAARTNLSPHFSPAKVKNLMELGRPSVGKLLSEIEDELDKNGEGNEIDIKSRAMFMTTDLTAAFLMGIKSNVFEEREKSGFYTSAKDLNTPVSLLKIFLGMTSKKVYNFFKIVTFSPTANEFIKDVLRISVATRKEYTGSTKVLMDGLLEIMNKNKDYDDHFLLSQGTVMWTGGIETTSQTLTFALFELANNPLLQSKLRNSLGTTEGHVLLKRVIQETLRKYPLFALLTRECTKRCKLSTGLVVEPGTILLIPSMSIQWDKKYYPEPDKFRPDREYPRGTYLPFGLGPRICIGMRLGLTVLEESLTSLLRKYEFSPSDADVYPIPLESKTFFTTPKGGVWMKVRRAQQEYCS